MDNTTTSQPVIAAPSTATPLANISTATLVAAMQSSFTSAKFALQQELGVGLAVFASTGRVDADTKKKLRDVYIASGWAATNPSDVDYKTTLRRCQIISVLYTHLGRDAVASWVSGLAEGMVINTIIQNIAPLSLYSMDSVLFHCGKVRQPPKAKVAPITEAPTAPEGFVERRGVPTAEETLTPQGGLAEGHEGPLQPHLFRRATDAEATPETMTDLEAERYESWLANRGENPILNARQLAAGYHHIHTEHLAITVPPTCGKDEIIKAALALMSLANSMDGAVTVGDLPRETREELEEEIAEEDAATIIAHQKAESDRVAAEALAAKAKPVAAPSRYRAKPIAKK